MIVPILNFRSLEIKNNNTGGDNIKDNQRAAKYAAALNNARNNLNNNEVVTITSLTDTYLLATGAEAVEDVNNDYSLLLDKLSKAKDRAYDLIGQEAIIRGLDEVCESLPEGEEQERFSKLHICPLEDAAIQELIYLQGVQDTLKNPDLMRGLLNIIDKLPQDLRDLDLDMPTA